MRRQQNNECGHCAAELTLYDRTIVGTIERTPRRTKRLAATAGAFGLLSSVTLAGFAPAQAVEYGGFSTTATASPVKLEIFEPAIPIPTEPQFELNFSYTRVLGDSGPSTKARASALWPGPAIGEGLKTFGEQLGLPAALTENGYPVQVNAQFPGDVTQQAQEPLPGMIQRVNAGDERTVAKAGYTPSGDLADGDAGSGPKGSNPLDLLGGGLGGLTNLLSGTKSGNNTNPVAGNPLGALSLVLDLDGMTSVSSTDYDGETVTATATSRIGEARLLLGLIKLTGINVVTKVVSTVDSGPKVSRTVDVGGMTIAGQKFAFGPDGFTAAGSTTAIPGLPTTAAGLLKMLGIEIEVPKPVITKDGDIAKIEAEAVRITLDLKPLRSKLPSLPLDDLVSNLPELPGQANLLKGFLLSLNTFAPKFVLRLGYAATSAATVPVFDGGSSGGGDVGAPGGGDDAGLGGDSGTVADGGEVPLAEGPVAEAASPTTTTPLAPVSAPGLPPLNSVPTLMSLAGLGLAAAAGWYLRRAGGLLFGGAGACSHGLQTGLPDLRKA